MSPLLQESIQMSTDLKSALIMDAGDQAECGQCRRQKAISALSPHRLLLVALIRSAAPVAGHCHIQ